MSGEIPKEKYAPQEIPGHILNWDDKEKKLPKIPTEKYSFSQNPKAKRQ